MADNTIVILGAGPAGLGAAYKLRRERKANVVVLEQAPVVGGLAHSPEIGGQRVDQGSHRLHPACDPVVLEDIRTLLGDDLLDRPRHGRIRLRGRWIHFPLKPVDLLLHLDPPFAIGSLLDRVRKKPWSGNGRESFASVLWDSLGPTICNEFYFPYARKIWGHDPDELSPIQAKRRVSASSFPQLIRKVMSSVPGFKPPGAGRFYYPRHGFGQISDAYAAAAAAEGADIRLGCRVTSLTRTDDRWVAVATTGDSTFEIAADYVWSTVPIPILARLIQPAPPPEVERAASAIDYRSIALIYLTLDVDRFTEFDAHYFPGSDTRITRLSETKVYADRSEPRGRTTLCAELPCAAGDEHWNADDAALGDLVAADLERAGIPLPGRPSALTVRRLRHAYPIYTHGYDKPFDELDRWIDSVPDFLSYGRQGLFAHDNTHHALFMAYSAVDCLVDGRFDEDRWSEYRKVFNTHVVVD
jgi:protoporphyrinogen oxidase